MYLEMWYRAWCPHCDRVNWVCNGNPEDITQIDADGFCCWKCQSQVPLNDHYLFDEEDDLLEEYEEGLKHPPKE